MDHLQKRKINCESINSKMGEKERKRVLTDLSCKAPNTRFLYVTPEQCATGTFKGLLERLVKYGKVRLKRCFHKEVGLLIVRLITSWPTLSLTRPTASRNGDTTSARTTSSWASSAPSPVPACHGRPSQPPPRPPSSTTSRSSWL